MQKVVEKSTQSKNTKVSCTSGDINKSTENPRSDSNPLVKSASRSKTLSTMPLIPDGSTPTDIWVENIRTVKGLQYSDRCFIMCGEQLTENIINYACSQMVLARNLEHMPDNKPRIYFQTISARQCSTKHNYKWSGGHFL